MPNTSPNKPLKLVVKCGVVPSFKNRKKSGLTKSGRLYSYKPNSIKERMQELEDAILSALYSECQTTSEGTDGECLKRLRTALSGLSDDSLNEMPEGSYSRKLVPKGDEGVEIIIEKLL